jgi:hypothetical protein
MIADDNDNDNDNDENALSFAALVDVPMLASSTIAEVEAAAMELQADEEAELQSWLNLTSVLMTRTKEIRHRVEQIAIKWIEANGPMISGDLHYSVGYRRAVRCLDKQKAFDLILQASDGDLNALVDHLRADPFKYGSARGLLGEFNYNQVFKTEARPKLVAGTPRVELLTTNTRYIPTRQSAARHNQTIDKHS